MWGNARLFILAISSAVLFTMILVASNTMAMSVRQRTAVCCLRTLGFAPATSSNDDRRVFSDLFGGRLLGSLVRVISMRN